MLPLRLTLHNYCQHRHRVIDFTKGDVIAITASNGFGKSNVFFALKNALTGGMTPGAKKLEDDVYDQASAFTNELEFVLSNGDTGRITRTVQRKGANSVVLEIKGKDRTETFTKSAEAIAKFEKLLGIHPREGCDVVIAEQRSIEDLLFAPTTKRLSRFEAFLHGDTFTAPIKALDAEKAALFIDELATDRRSALDTSLKDTRFAHEGLQMLERRQRVTQESKKAIAARAKRALVELHAPQRTTFLDCQRDLDAVGRSLTEHARTITAIPSNLGQLVADKEAKLSALALAWSNYNSALQLQNDAAKTQQDLTAAVANQAKAKQLLQNLEAAADRFSKVQQAIHYVQLHAHVRTTQERQKALALTVTELVAREKALTEQKTALAEQCAQLSGPLVTLREAHSLLSKANASGHAAHCPVCQSELKGDHTHSLAQMIAHLEKTLAAPQLELRGVEQALATLNRDLAGQRRELTLLAQQLPTSQQLLAAQPVPTGDLAGATLEALNATPVTAVTPVQHRQAQQSEAQHQNEVSRLTGQLAVQKAKLPEKVTPPSEPESRLTQLRNEVAGLREQDRNLAAAFSAQKVQQEQQVVLTQKVATLKTLAAAASIPPLDTEFVLSAEEVTFLVTLDAGAAELVSLSQNRATQEALIKQLELQIAQTDACIVGAKDTQAYANHLDSMVGYFKSLPHIIMRSQLQKLCHAMDEIIQGFHFFQPFKLTINDELDFVLQYPNKLTRPIGKASGGERIILGFAFRLAAHRTLAPEMPWLAIDEPTNHLAEENISVMADVIRHLSANLSKYNLKKLIISTHSPLIAAQANYQINLGTADLTPVAVQAVLA